MSYGTMSRNPAILSDTSPGSEPTVKKIAVIYGRINYLTLGSIITVAKEYVDRVFVLTGGNDRHIASISHSLGAVLMGPWPGESVESASSPLPDDPDGMLVLLNGDGSHDPYSIPVLFDQLNKGYDLVVSSSTIDYGTMNENVLFFNNKKAGGRFSGFVACTASYFKQFVRDSPLNDKLDISTQVHSFARTNDFRVRQIDNGGFELFSLFRIGVVVPAYNEEKLIEETLKGVPGYVTRVYVIDDCSRDHTPDILKSIADPRVRSVRHEKNMGVGAAIITGYKMALEDDMDIVAVMAGDNQMDPVQLPRLLLPIMEGKADYTKGNRLLNKEFRKGMSAWRSFGNSILTLITKVGSGYWNIMDPQNGYTAISRQALEAINLDSIYTYYGYCNDLLIKLNAFGMRSMDVVMPARYGTERSHIKYSKYIMKVAPMIFRGFLWRLKTKYVILDFHPLVLFYAASMVMVPFGILFSMWILMEKILRHEVSDNFPLLAAFITLMGVQFLLFAMLFDMQEDKNAGGMSQ